MKNILFATSSAIVACGACGGQTIGDLDGGNTDSGKSDTGVTKACLPTAKTRGKGICGYAMSDSICN